VIRNGWTLYAHPVLLDQIEALAAKVRRQKKPNSGAAKVLKWIVVDMFERIPADPTLAAYRQGRTLGDSYKHWFRSKYAGRFRLFFRYDSAAKVIVFAWVNDENTLRTRGARNDAYAVFRGMLDDGNPPDSWSALLAQSSSIAALDRFSAKGGRSETE
jgi:toxin YhaV